MSDVAHFLFVLLVLGIVSFVIYCVWDTHDNTKKILDAMNRDTQPKDTPCSKNTP